MTKNAVDTPVLESRISGQVLLITMKLHSECWIFSVCVSRCYKGAQLEKKKHHLVLKDFLALWSPKRPNFLPWKLECFTGKLNIPTCGSYSWRSSLISQIQDNNNIWITNNTCHRNLICGVELLNYCSAINQLAWKQKNVIVPHWCCSGSFCLQ